MMPKNINAAIAYLFTCCFMLSFNASKIGKNNIGIFFFCKRLCKNLFGLISRLVNPACFTLLLISGALRLRCPRAYALSHYDR